MSNFISNRTLTICLAAIATIVLVVIHNEPKVNISIDVPRYSEGIRTDMYKSCLQMFTISECECHEVHLAGVSFVTTEELQQIISQCGITY